MLAATLGVLVLALALLSSLAPAPYAEASAERMNADWSPSRAPTIAVPLIGKPLAGATLHKVERDANGRESERAIPVSLVPADPSSGLAPWKKLQVLAADGASALAYDGDYRLSVSINTLAPALPLPVTQTVTSSYYFRTPASPHIIVPEGVVQMGYGEPVPVRWDSPVQTFAVAVTPPVASRTWIDPADPRIGYVALTDAQPGTRYEVRVVEALGVNGAPLLAPASMTVDVPAPPKIDVAKVQLRNGTRVSLPWDQPVQSFTYEVSPATASRAEIDRSDPRTTYIVLEQPAQGQEYTVKITGAVSTLGAPLTETQAPFAVAVPPPLDVIKLSPRGSEIGVARDRPISVRFSAPVEDRAAAEAAVKITPALSGRFEWPEPDRLLFVPDAPLPALTEITVLLAGGPEGVVAENGAFFAEPYEYSFTTRPDKRIDVDLSRQRLTLFEGGKAVFAAPVSTGVRGAETPTGEFLVTLKWEKLRMRGTNPSGISYDIPDVPWVMSFLGDYTFHGAPWRGQFGTPLSNGCVSMETGTAKRVYDWTPPGTLVTIHY